MKPKLFLSLALSITLFLASSTTLLAAGQTCCNSGWSTGNTSPSLDPNKCCNAAAGICMNTNCEPNETCTNNICVSQSTSPTTISTPNLPATCCYDTNPSCAGTSCSVSGVRCGRVEACALVDPSMAQAGLTPCTTHQRCSLTGYSGCTWDGRINYCTSLGYPTPSAGSFGTPAPNSTDCTVNGSKGINTALGCISYDATNGGFVKSLLNIAIGLGGGVALLLILYGVFTITTSAGIPEKLKAGNELISSAVAGLLFIIMAIFMMNLIGIKIFALPGLQ